MIFQAPYIQVLNENKKIYLDGDRFFSVKNYFFKLSVLFA
ncbi:hypothetical protein HMPREF1987_00714 [Peptostreptococcaceae bacterium oral taxon 113 str. W5053]|nr:hypothetical protein HMPREF1987_00714 [Peptostreptococcaceae bacterium oral taxon 113 str. W5053]